MNVKFIKRTKFGYKFLLQSTRYDVVNAIRRSIVGEVLTLAVDKVMVYKNESVMPDEFIAHRLGLVPLNSRDFDEEKEVSLYLKKTGGVVKAGDIETNGIVEVTHKNIPILVLNEGKSVELELVLKPGNGNQHTKWSSALVYYNNVPSIKQHGKVDKSIIKTCPKGLLDFKADKVVIRDPYDCDACRFCETATHRNLELVTKEDEFVLTIEPYGNLDIDLIIKGASKYLEDELTSLGKEIKDIK